MRDHEHQHKSKSQGEFLQVKLCILFTDWGRREQSSLGQLVPAAVLSAVFYCIFDYIMCDFC